MRRKLAWHTRRTEAVPLLILGGVAAAYWQRQALSLPSELGFYYLTAILLLCFHWLQSRLKAMQVRLAWMHDHLDALAGNQPKHHVETELDA